LVNFNENYITVFDSNFSCRRCKVLVTEVKIWSTLEGQDQNVHELRECIMDERDTLDQRIIDKVVWMWWDFEILGLQEEDSLNIRREIFSLLTFFHVMFLKGRLSIWKSYQKAGRPDFIEHGVLC